VTCSSPGALSEFLEIVAFCFVVSVIVGAVSLPGVAGGVEHEARNVMDRPVRI
jgi:hypothetical protein